MRARYHTLNIMSVTTLNDRLMAEVIRAGMFSRLKTLEMSGTNLSSAPEMFAQIVLLLENGRRYAISPITKFLLSSTGLGEPHFRRILEAVQIMHVSWTQRVHGPNVPTSRRRTWRCAWSC